MNFSQRFGLFILILISVSYVYFSFFHKEGLRIELGNKQEQNKPFYDLLMSNDFSKPEKKAEDNKQEKIVKIYLLDETGNLKAVNRVCNSLEEKSCFEFAMKELISAPSRWEKSKGFTSEIPQGTRVLSVRESNDSVMIDLSSNFESGGGAESTYMRIKQIIKTANANTSIPTYLYINGRQANVISGEGIMIKQPLSERSFDE